MTDFDQARRRVFGEGRAYGGVVGKAYGGTNFGSGAVWSCTRAPSSLPHRRAAVPHHGGPGRHPRASGPLWWSPRALPSLYRAYPSPGLCDIRGNGTTGTDCVGPGTHRNLGPHGPFGWGAE